MGIKSAAKVKWKATGLTIKTIQDLNLGKRIDVDGNALAFKMHASNKALGETLHLMAYHLKQLAFSGGFIAERMPSGHSNLTCASVCTKRTGQM